MRRTTLRHWRDALLFGAALGTMILGVGGRVAMRLAALAVEQDPTFTLGGSATVVGAGALVGMAVAALQPALRFVPGVGRMGRVVMFWVVSLMVALVILWPLNQRRLELFLPLAVLYDAGLQFIWSRRYPHSTSP